MDGKPKPIRKKKSLGGKKHSHLFNGRILLFEISTKVVIGDLVFPRLTLCLCFSPSLNSDGIKVLVELETIVCSSSMSSSCWYNDFFHSMRSGMHSWMKTALLVNSLMSVVVFIHLNCSSALRWPRSSPSSSKRCSSMSMYSKAEESCSGRIS